MMGSFQVDPKQNGVRRTPTFRPLNQNYHPIYHNRQTRFAVSSQQTILFSQSINCKQHSSKIVRLWRLYFEKSLRSYKRIEIQKFAINSFEFLLSNDQLDKKQNSCLLINTKNVLIERLDVYTERYLVSNLDYNCILVRQIQWNKAKNLLQLYIVQSDRTNQNLEFNSAISVKIKQEYLPFYLVSKNKMLHLLKDPAKPIQKLQIKDYNLQETDASISQNILIIKNLSPRIIAIKFTQENFSRNNEPLVFLICNSEIYQSILFRINRIKYKKYRIQDVGDFRQLYCSNNITKAQSKIQSKMTTQNLKNTLIQRPQIPESLMSKISNLSTGIFEPSQEYKQVKTHKILFDNQRSLKISQKMRNNQKQSNVITSDIGYPVSVQDKKEKPLPFFDQFQNLFFQEHEVQPNQLVLNDSFQQFQRQLNSKKNKQIIEYINRRKQKQLEQKKIQQSLRQRIRDLATEEKQLIIKNVRLRKEINIIKANQTPLVLKQKIKNIKIKIAQLTDYQKKLYDGLIMLGKKPIPQKLAFKDKTKKISYQSIQKKCRGTIKISMIPYQNVLKVHPLGASLKMQDHFRQTYAISGSQISTINDDQSLNNKNFNTYSQEFGSIEFNAKSNLQSMICSFACAKDQQPSYLNNLAKYQVVQTNFSLQQREKNLMGHMSLVQESQISNNIQSQYKKK